MFDLGEKAAFTSKDFIKLSEGEDYIEVKSRHTGQDWLVKKFDREGYPPVVLYHRHAGADCRYHVHFVYGDDNALLAYLEIMQHERYIIKRNEKRWKITTLSNRALMQAAFA